MAGLHIPAKTAQQALTGLENSADSPLASAVERAKTIVSFIERSGSPQPFVFPTEIKGVQFEWHSGKCELDVEVLPEGESVAYATFIDGTADREGDISEDVEGGLQSLLRWMASR